VSFFVNVPLILLISVSFALILRLVLKSYSHETSFVISAAS